MHNRRLQLLAARRLLVDCLKRHFWPKQVSFVSKNQLVFCEQKLRDYGRQQSRHATDIACQSRGMWRTAVNTMINVQSLIAMSSQVAAGESETADQYKTLFCRATVLNVLTDRVGNVGFFQWIHQKISRRHNAERDFLFSRLFATIQWYNVACLDSRRVSD